MGAWAVTHQEVWLVCGLLLMMLMTAMDHFCMCVEVIVTGQKLSSMIKHLRRGRMSLTPSDSQRDKAYQEAELRFPEAEPFYARVGDIGIWHERLLHGGDAIKNWTRTRLSLVV